MSYLNTLEAYSDTDFINAHPEYLNIMILNNYTDISQSINFNFLKANYNCHLASNYDEVKNIIEDIAIHYLIMPIKLKDDTVSIFLIDMNEKHSDSLLSDRHLKMIKKLEKKKVFLDNLNTIVLDVNLHNVLVQMNYFLIKILRNTKFEIISSKLKMIPFDFNKEYLTFDYQENFTETIFNTLDSEHEVYYKMPFIDNDYILKVQQVTQSPKELQAEVSLKDALIDIIPFVK